MYYSFIGILALIILLITNHDILFKKRSHLHTPASKAYRNFLLSVSLFLITDILWGVFDSLKLKMAMYIDTEFFFITMALGVLLLGQYTSVYLETKGIRKKIILAAGLAFFISVTILMIINIFTPIVFYIDDEYKYTTAISRYVILGVQIIMNALVSFYAFIWALRTKGLIGKRYFTIGFFGIIMLISISIQLFFPLLPLYSMGCMLGTALLRTFIIENEKEEYRINLEEEYKKEQQQSQELKTAWEVAYTDALTGAKSKLAYLEAIESIDKSIYKEELKDFAIVAFDINNLKEINDTYGHQAGDEYIKSAYELIKDVFKNSSIFRIGGDEFIVILEKDDYINRVDLVNKFNNMIEDNARNKKIVIASGLTDYDPKLDKTLRHIIERADFLMYDKKKKLKEIINNNEKALL